MTRSRYGRKYRFSRAERAVLLWLRRRRRAAGGPGDRILVSSPGQLVAVRSGACLPRHAVCYAIRGGECRGYSAGGLRHPNAVGLRAGLLPSRSQ